MPGETKHGIECSQFEALLSEAIDGKLGGSRKQSEKESFEAHGRVCAICGPLLADALAGQQWLKSLEEVEPPLPHQQYSGSDQRNRAPVAYRNARARTGIAGVRQWWEPFVTPTAALFAAPFRDVVRDDLLLLLAGLERGRSEAVRCREDRRSTLRPQADVLHHSGQGREVLREYPFRVRNRIPGTRVQAVNNSRRTRPRETQPKTQEQQ